MQCRKSKTLPPEKKRCPTYNTKPWWYLSVPPTRQDLPQDLFYSGDLEEGGAWLLWRSGALVSNLSLSLLPDSLWHGVVVSVRMPSMSQIDLLKKFSYSIGLCIATSHENTAQILPMENIVKDAGVFKTQLQFEPAFKNKQINR